MMDGRVLVKIETVIPPGEGKEHTTRKMYAESFALPDKTEDVANWIECTLGNNPDGEVQSVRMTVDACPHVGEWEAFEEKFSPGEMQAAIGWIKSLDVTSKKEVSIFLQAEVAPRSSKKFTGPVLV